MKTNELIMPSIGNDGKVQASIYPPITDIDLESSKENIENEVKQFVLSLSSLLEGAYRLKPDRNMLRYAFVLKDDTIHNRQAFFEFTDEYEEEEVASDFPLRFYFVRADLVERMPITETIFSEKELLTTA